MGNDLKKINEQLTKIKLRDIKGNLYVRGQFPNEDGTFSRKTISLGCKNTPEGLKIAIGKAKEIDSKLMLDKWVIEVKNTLTVLKAIQLYERDYWTKYEPTVDRLCAWKRNQTAYFKQLPEDEIFNNNFLKKAVTYFPPASYKQFHFCQLIRPVAKFHKINFDFLPYMQYRTPEINLRELPTNKSILIAYENESYLPHKWSLGVLALFGLRPHELYRSEFDFNRTPPLIYVGKHTKNKKERTAYPLLINGLNLFDLPNQWNTICQTNNLDRANVMLGQNVSEWFKKYPFNAYQLRHYYAVRGALEGISPVILCKWMGHSLEIHYKYYGSLISNRESDIFWKDKFLT